MPAMEYLHGIWVESDQKLLNEEMEAAFHHMIAQLLFANARFWRHLQTAITFLKAKVKSTKTIVLN